MPGRENGGFMKGVIVLGLLLNVAFAGYNGWTRWGAMDAKDRIKESSDKVVRIKKLVLKYRHDLRTVRTQKMVLVKNAPTYFANQARLAGFHGQNDLTIPNKIQSNRLTGTNFTEERWKITFKGRDSYHSMKKVARFCELIETGAPKFQIKEVDFGQRIETWGADQWKVSFVTVRRLTPRAKKGKRS